MCPPSLPICTCICTDREASSCVAVNYFVSNEQASSVLPIIIRWQQSFSTHLAAPIGLQLCSIQQVHCLLFGGGHLVSVQVSWPPGLPCLAQPHDTNLLSTKY